MAKAAKGMESVDLVRFNISIPYTFRGNHNKQGGRLGDWAFDVELSPWPWLRYETNWSIPSHFIRGSRDARITTWNNDLVIVGGMGRLDVAQSTGYYSATRDEEERGPESGLTELVMTQGQWYLGMGHRYSANDKTETVLEFDWRPTEKWEIGTFHRFTWKEVQGGVKRYDNIREYQYRLRRDLHDWIGEFVYRVDRELGEELFLVFTLKAYPAMPVEFAESYHQPKIGSQSSPFSPVRR